MKRGEWDNRKNEGLSQREVQVLKQIAQGRSDVQIGMALGVSDNTVRAHVMRAKKKLHVTTLTQLVVKAIMLAKADTGES